MIIDFTIDLKLLLIQLSYLKWNFMKHSIFEKKVVARIVRSYCASHFFQLTTSVQVKRSEKV